MKKQFHYVTTTHKDVAERLSQINPTLAAEARKVLDVNKSERHIRGGLATKEKYLHMEKKNWWGIV
jgi:putative DeoR family transcriptional regulator (stage III sporulation protein D)